MAHIRSNIIERMLNIIKINKVPGYDNKVEHIANGDTCDNMKCDQVSIKEKIAKLIKENEKYFICEAMRTTADTIFHYGHCNTERLKSFGYLHGIAADIFEKYGIFIYVTDLSTYTYAPRVVKCELQILINEYGLEKVTEEIAIYLKDNYSNQFGINIVCTP